MYIGTKGTKETKVPSIGFLTVIVPETRGFARFIAAMCVWRDGFSASWGGIAPPEALLRRVSGYLSKKDSLTVQGAFGKIVDVVQAQEFFCCTPLTG